MKAVAVRKKDWLAVTDREGAVTAVIEVVRVWNDMVFGFELFPCDGRPVRGVEFERCLPFRKPECPEG